MKCKWIHWIFYQKYWIDSVIKSMLNNKTKFKLHFYHFYLTIVLLFEREFTVAIGYLVVHTNDELFAQLYSHLLQGLKSNVGSSEKLRTFVQCSGVLSRYSTARLGKHLSELVPIISGYAAEADGDDELREICLQTLESFVLRCPLDISTFVPDIIQSCFNTCQI